MDDEDRHAALYAKAIGKLGQPVVQLPIADVFNEVIRTHTHVDFAMQQDDDDAMRRIKLAHFFGHLHFLETRVVRSLEYHAEACASGASRYVSKVVQAILDDERHHVSYTRAAVESLLPRAQARAVLATHRRAEAKANLDFSSRQLGRLVREQAQRFPARSRLVYFGCAKAMEAMLFHG
jgi:hypothetical protein